MDSPSTLAHKEGGGVVLHPPFHHHHPASAVGLCQPPPHAATLPRPRFATLLPSCTVFEALFGNVCATIASLFLSPFFLFFFFFFPSLPSFFTSPQKSHITLHSRHSSSFLHPPFYFYYKTNKPILDGEVPAAAERKPSMRTAFMVEAVGVGKATHKGKLNAFKDEHDTVRITPGRGGEGKGKEFGSILAMRGVIIATEGLRCG